MSVYMNDNASYFERALQSITEDQTVMPNEIVLVVDGPISEDINKVIEKYTGKYPIFKIIRLQENMGLGNALSIAIENSTNEIIARMDSDDISMPNRFENQLMLMQEANVDILGGYVAEFVEDENKITGYRTVCLLDDEIKKDLKKRCPFNHSTVMLKKSTVVLLGGYIDWYCNEDYHLWIRMAQNNCKFSNSNEVYVKFRLGNDFYKRRGGLKYFKSEKGLQKIMLKSKMITFGTYFVNIIKRFIVQVLMPTKLRGWAFRKFARKRVNNG